MAIDTPGGLAVPNIKNCESKNVWEIAADLARLSQLGQEQKFSRDDLINGTITLSNIGAVIIFNYKFNKMFFRLAAAHI